MNSGVTLAPAPRRHHFGNVYQLEAFRRALKEAPGSLRELARAAHVSHALLIRIRDGHRGAHARSGRYCSHGVGGVGGYVHRAGRKPPRTKGGGVSLYRRKYRHNGRTCETSAWWASYYIDGKRYRESTGETAKKKAQDWERNRIVERAGSPVDPARAEELRFEDLHEAARAHYRRKQNRSTDRMERCFRRLASKFGGWRLNRITAGPIDQYAEECLERGDAPATINRDLAMLRLGFRRLHKKECNRHVPPIDFFTEDNTRTGFLEHAEYLTLRATLPPRLRPLLDTGYVTGWRVQALLSRTWADVDLEEGWLRIEGKDVKNKTGKAFPLGVIPLLRDSLEEQHAKKREIEKRTGRIVTALFFYHEGATAGQPIKDFRGAWKAASKAVGLEGLLFHDLKRSAARNLVRAGVPIPLAMELIGHKTASIFKRYCIVDETMLKEGAEKVGAYLAAQAGAPERKIAGGIGG